MSIIFSSITFMLLLLLSSLYISLGLENSQHIICDIPIKIETQLIYVHNYLIAYGVYLYILCLHICLQYFFRKVDLLIIPHVIINIFYVIVATILLIKNKPCNNHIHVNALLVIWTYNVFTYIFGSMFLLYKYVERNNNERLNKLGLQRF